MSEFNRYITANEVIRRVLGPLGLPKPADVFNSTEATPRQMIDLLTECGQELLAEYDWQILIATQTIVTTTDVDYPLPDDFERYIDGTGWNNTGRIPLIGPMSPQQWRLLQARQLGGTTLRLQYVIRDGLLSLYFAPNPTQTLQIDYISRGWVQDATDPTVHRDYVKNSGDLILYNPILIVNYLKYKWRDAKGFDATSAMLAYNKALEKARYSDRPHATLPLAGQRGYPYITNNNLSDTNYGLG
jgi:hypothetical protein